MMLPPRPCSIMARATYLVNRNALHTVTSSCWRNSASDVSTTPLPMRKATPFTRTSTPPSSRRARSHRPALAWTSGLDGLELSPEHAAQQDHARVLPPQALPRAIHDAALRDLRDVVLRVDAEGPILRHALPEQLHLVLGGLVSGLVLRGVVVTVGNELLLEAARGRAHQRHLVDDEPER